MAIDLSNYEAYFLDYHEGRLDAAAREELEQFLAAHPALRDELAAFEAVELEVPDRTFPGKERLKRTETPAVPREAMIAYYEEDLDAAARRRLEQEVAADHSLEKEFEIMGRLRLEPDTRVVYEGKDGLKRHPRVISFRSAAVRYAAAASVVFAFAAYFFVGRNPDKPALTDAAPAQAAGTVPSATVSPSAPSQESFTNRRTNMSPAAPRSTAPKTVITKEPAQPPVTSTQPLVAGTAGSDSLGEIHPTAEARGPAVSSMQEPSVALVSPSSEHSFPVTTLQDVFSAKELEELGQSPTARPKDKNRLWSLAAKGVSALGRASGTEMALNKSSDLFEETESVGLTVGRFSVEHTSVTDSR